jgi:hypothetical protein
VSGTSCWAPRSTSHDRAPTGFGKTTLLADWATSASCPVAWLSLDEADNDPARSWRHVVAALDRAREGLREQLLPLLTALTALSGQGVVTAVISRLEAKPEELALHVAPIRRTISPMIACILTCQPENPRSACVLAWIRPESTYKEIVWDTDMRAPTCWSFADDTTFRPRSTWIPLVLPALGGISR